VPVPGSSAAAYCTSAAQRHAGYLYYENPGVLVPPHSELGPGWHVTGDVVDIDDDGFVHILGRVKRFAKVAGEMISLELVEKIAVAASPGFQHAASSRRTNGAASDRALYHRPALTRDRLQQAAHVLARRRSPCPGNSHVQEIPLLGRER